MHPCDLKFLTAKEGNFGYTGGCILSYANDRLNGERRNLLAVQWLGVHTLTAKRLGSIPGWETKILQAEKPKDKTYILLYKNIYIYKYIYSIVCGRK